MTVDELRKALEGVPGDMEVIMSYDCGCASTSVEEAKIDYIPREMRIIHDGPICEAGTPFFKIGDGF
jgi:hypothetical protein